MAHMKDTSNGVLYKTVGTVINKFRPDLEELAFLCCWCDVPKKDGNMSVLADVFKLNNRDRDLYGYDLRLTVYTDRWEELDQVEREKLIFHELEHISVSLMSDLDDEEEEDEEEEIPEDEKTAEQVLEELLKPEVREGTPLRDKDNRIMFSLVDHDIDIRRFKSEMLLYGLSEYENGIRKYLNKIYKERNLAKEEVAKKKPKLKKEKPKKVKKVK